MSDSETQHMMALQTSLTEKFLELGLTPGNDLNQLAHHLAELAAMSTTFAQQSIPLLLSLSPVHRASFATLIAKIKHDLESIRDNINDVEQDLANVFDVLSGQ